MVRRCESIGYLVRQIKEVADALDKLSPTYGGIQLEGLRTVLQAELAARISPSKK
jgi:hypothetical protein